MTLNVTPYITVQATGSIIGKGRGRYDFAQGKLTVARVEDSSQCQITIELTGGGGVAAATGKRRKPKLKVRMKREQATILAEMLSNIQQKGENACQHSGK